MKAGLLKRLAPFGQQHVLDGWERLTPAQQAGLAAQVRQLDLPLIARLFEGRGRHADIGRLLQRALPPPAIRLDARRNPLSPAVARHRGEDLLRAGRVGAILVAGGQGTRLGFPYPKGMYPLGPVSGRTLFQIHIDKLRATSRRYGQPIPLCVMTSPATHEETVRHFADHERLGLAGDDLLIFCQGTMPAVDAQSGRLLLESPGRLAQSPDGHGGMLAALAGSGTLEILETRGIQHLFYFQVDNPLVDVCGVEFMGYHALSNAEMSTQVVAKRDPLERVGNVVEVDGRLLVVEYSDLPDEFAQRRAADGPLEIWAGSIAVHAFRTSFLRRMAETADGLPFHIAKKKVPHVDGAGELVEPHEPNAIKFERFIFDLMPAAHQAIVVEVDPAEAFAPLKNAPGAAIDTAEWVQARMCDQHRRWLRAARAKVADTVPVEINPLWAMDPDEVASKIPAGMAIEQATYLR